MFDMVESREIMKYYKEVERRSDRYRELNKNILPANGVMPRDLSGRVNYMYLFDEDTVPLKSDQY